MATSKVGAAAPSPSTPEGGPAAAKAGSSAPKAGSAPKEGTNRATYWYVQGCPLAEECSKASWAKCQSCASWESEEHCRTLVFDHLRRSSLHYYAPIEDHRKIAAEVEVFETAWEYDEVEDEHGEKRKPEEDANMPPPNPKRQRQGDSGARGSSSGGSAGGGSSQLAMVAGRRSALAVARAKAPSQPAHVTLPAHVSLGQVAQDDDMVVISRTTLKRMAESVERAAAAANHAVKISTQVFRCTSNRV